MLALHPRAHCRALVLQVLDFLKSSGLVTPSVDLRVDAAGVDPPPPPLGPPGSYVPEAAAAVPGMPPPRPSVAGGKGAKGPAAAAAAAAAAAGGVVKLAQDVEAVIDGCKKETETVAKQYYAVKVRGGYCARLAATRPAGHLQQRFTGAWDVHSFPQRDELHTSPECAQDATTQNDLSQLVGYTVLCPSHLYPSCQHASHPPLTEALSVCVLPAGQVPAHPLPRPHPAQRGGAAAGHGRRAGGAAGDHAGVREGGSQGAAHAGGQ